MPLRFGVFTFDTSARELRRDGVAVPLSPKAFRLLELLVEARPNPVTRQALYEALWPDVVVEPGNLHSLVSEVRAATARDAIRTVHRVGYAFVATGAFADSTSYSLLLGGEEIPLRSGENIIGRDPHDAICIPVPEVSRHHARLVVSGDRVTIEDLGSKNGTFIGTERVEAPTEVRAGEAILVGTVRMILMAGDAGASTVTAG
jgi:DNA-binding winged helix-turn-helix (wHTH) protein